MRSEGVFDAAQKKLEDKTKGWSVAKLVALVTSKIRVPNRICIPIRISL